MPTILTNTNPNDSPSIASARPSTTEPRGPHTSAPAAGNQSNKDDTESSHASVDNAPPVMPDNLETDNAPHSGASAIDGESHASPQGNTPLTPVHETLHHTTGENHERPTQAGIDPGASQAGALEAHFKAADVEGEDSVTKNQDHTCGCQSQKLTGWAAVEKTLTDFDREEVGGYKEDIDSLLTFAGLYSGVLTAFVIVSFTQLSEDTATESLRVLRIIANQTSGNPVSPSLTLTDPSPFQPSVAAKRVNILWFASLVISLSTASFSILVKQWLRSYMAFASSSPQGALRIRHFRRAGLEAWRVFGIASMLPFLLQISLALFFVGLCFFTADIDPTIGNTTLPLVCAWAFLFIAVTLSPIFSAKCPYKTPVVSPVTTMLRRYIGHTLSRWGRASAAYLLVEMLLVPFGVIAVISLWFITDKLKFRLLGEAVNGLRRLAVFIREMKDKRGLKQVPLEEADVRVRNSEDMAILITADSIQSNTEPDLITLDAALKQTNPSWKETMLLLLQIIGNRVPLSTDITVRQMQLPTAMIDCSSLSVRTRDHLRGLLQSYVIDHLSEELCFIIPGDPEAEFDTEVDQSIGASILLVWAMTIHIAFSPEYTQLPEKLLAPVDCALEYLYRTTSWSFAVDEHQVAFATCIRIMHDNIRARLPDKVHSAAAVLLRYWPETKRGDISFGGIPTNASLLALVFKDAARCLVRSLEQETIEVERVLSSLHFERAITLVTVLCTLSQRYQDGADEVLPYEKILTPLVVRVFNQRSWRAKKAILNAVSPASFDDSFDEDKVDHVRYCKFLMDTFSHNSETFGHDLMNAILDFAAIPIDERSWMDIIGRSAVIIRLLESYSSESRMTNRLLWRRIFLVLARQIHSLGDSPYWFATKSNQVLLVETRCGSKIDQMLKLQVASDTIDGIRVDRRNHSEQFELERRNRRPQSYIPDYFCLTLERFTDPAESPNGVQTPIWTAEHLHNISTEERERIVEEEEREMEDIGIDAIIADARESYID